MEGQHCRVDKHLVVQRGKLLCSRVRLGLFVRCDVHASGSPLTRLGMKQDTDDVAGRVARLLVAERGCCCHSSAVLLTPDKDKALMLREGHSAR